MGSRTIQKRRKGEEEKRKRLLSTPYSLLPHLLLIVFAMVLILPSVLGKSLYWGDIGLYFAPMTQFQKESLQTGILPLWNPYTLGGQPFAGNPQMGWLYPTVWLLPFLSVGRYLAFVSWLHLFLAGEFTWLYLRNRRLSVAATLIGAMAFMGCDAVVSRLQFPPMVMAVVYLPLLLLAVDRIVGADDPRGYLLLVVSLALCLLAAHAQVTYLILLTVSLYALLRVLSKPRVDHFPLAFRMLGCGLLAMLLCLPYLLPVVELLKLSHRTELTAAGADRFVLLPHHLWNFVVPHFTGHPATGDYWGGGNAWEPSCFVGWLPLIFAGFIVLARPRWRSVQFWGIFGLLTLWMAFGTSCGLFWLSFNVLPGMSLFHDPARFLILTSFALAMLGAFGVDHWLKSPNRDWRHSATVLTGAALPLALFAYQWNPAASESDISRILPAKAQNAGNNPFGLTYFPTYSRIWDVLIEEGYRDYGISDGLFLRTQFGSFLPNATMLSHLATPDGYEPIGIDNAVNMESLMRKAIEADAPNVMPLLEARGVALLRHRPLAPYDVQLAATLGNGWRLVHRLRRVDGMLRLSAALNDPTFDPDNEAIVSQREQEIGDRGQGNAEGKSATVETIEIVPVMETPNRWRVVVRGNSQLGLLVTPLTDYPGWRCRVDGKSVPIFRANMASMGIEMPEGDHTVVLEYRPATLRAGLYLGGMAWCGFVAWGSSLWMKSRKRRQIP